MGLGYRIARGGYRSMKRDARSIARHSNSMPSLTDGIASLIGYGIGMIIVAIRNRRAAKKAAAAAAAVTTQATAFEPMDWELECEHTATTTNSAGHVRCHDCGFLAVA